MPDERTILAIGRIERALARIEAAAVGASADAELERLKEAHQALRSRVAGTISHIDQLLEGHGGAG